MDQWVAPGNEDQGNVHKQRLGEKRLDSNPSFPNASPTGKHQVRLPDNTKQPRKSCARAIFKIGLSDIFSGFDIVGN